MESRDVTYFSYNTTCKDWLNAYLIREKRFDDLERSTKEPEFQKSLIKELESII